MFQLHPVPSRLRWLLALLAHGLALAAVVHAGAPLWLKAGLALLTLASLWREARQYRGHGQRLALRLGANAMALWIDGQSTGTGPLRILHCSQWLIVLEFPLDRPRPLGRRLRLTLFPDSLTCDELRRLRRWLYYDKG